MKLNELSDNPGARADRKRIGRGIGSGTGKTSGKGHKGAKARKSNPKPRHFEGGQMPLYRRLPKRGFTNIFKSDYAIVNLGSVQRALDAGKLEGGITLATVQDGRRVEIPIGEGEIFLLPRNLPHSPRRPANTIGLVIERTRRAGERDGFQWYCENCGSKLHEEFAEITDIESQLPPIFERYFASTALRTCRQCGTVQEKPR